MTAPKISNRQLIQLASTYWQWRWLWASTTAAFAVLGLFYVLFLKGDTWVASQGLIIRDEANGAVMRLGRFESQTAMKAAQETVLEMARNSQVLSDALTQVGRESSWLGWWKSEAPPSNAEVEDLARTGVLVRAPRGAELGTTEVIYLDVMQSSRGRALELNKAVCDSLESRLKQVRRARANGVIDELLAAKEAAAKNLTVSTERLRQIEAEAGTDLSDLRGLTDTVVGGGSTREALETVKNELRKAELERQQVKVDLDMARESFDDPQQLLMTPAKIVNNQPGLRRLREGLAAASINTSQLAGRYTETHPLVIASRQTEAKIRDELRAELGVAVETLTKEYEISSAQVDRLKAQQHSLETRIAKLSQIRAGYANVASEVRARNSQLQEAERELAQAEATRDAAERSSLITRLDDPLIGEDPIGPGRSTILAGATLSGLFFGFGVVFLLSPMDVNINYGRRRYDYSGAAGRRAADRDPTGTPRPERRAESVEPDASGDLANPTEQAARVTHRPEHSEKASPAKATGKTLPSLEPDRSFDDSSNVATMKREGSESPTGAEPTNAPQDNQEESLAEAQAVISAALQRSFSEEANAPPQANPQAKT